MFDKVDYNLLIEEIKYNNLNMYGIEIFCNSEIAFQKMFESNIRYPIYSATKSFTATAIGIATHEGKIFIEEPISNYLEKRYIESMPVRLRDSFCKLPIKRFLTMSVSGYPFRPSGNDWLSNVLQYDLEYSEKPKFSYTNISAYLVGIACENAVGVNLMEYLKPRLFEPLGIRNPEYQCDPQGHFYGATGMYLTVHELSLLGQLYLQKGVFNGKRILSEKWVNEATKIQIDHADGGYGYFFWRNEASFSISGKWGQKCQIYPEKKLIITYLGDMPDNSKIMQMIVEKFVK